MNQVRIRLRTAKLGLVDAEAAYRKAKLDLGSLMNLKLEEIAQLELKGTITDVAPPPPPAEELRKLAVAERPDVVSVRLGIQRAEADVRLAKANAYSDVYVLWQPYTFQDNSPYGLKSQYSWALGVTVPLPIYNRNQGGISRAKINVTQSELQLGDLERQAQIDVEQAVLEYEVTRREVVELLENMSSAGAADSRQSPQTLHRGSDQRARLPGRSARLQPDRQAISRHGGPPPAQHAVAQHGRGPADHALTRSNRKVSWSGRVRDLREEKMGRRIPRDLRPFLEEFERRELLSAITDIMAANSLAAGREIAIRVSARRARPPSRSRSRRIKARSGQSTWPSRPRGR